MHVKVDQVEKGSHGSVLPAISFEYESRSATLVRTETQQRPTVLALIASGRMAPSRGTVTIDGEPSLSQLRHRVTIIDAPSVNEAPPDVRTVGVVAEELMFAGRTSTLRAAAAALEDLGLAHLARRRFSTLAPDDRIRLLVELALMRPSTDGIVLVAPDRHGGDPQHWWELCISAADRGSAVLVLAGDASTALIAGTAIGQAPDTVVWRKNDGKAAE